MHHHNGKGNTYPPEALLPRAELLVLGAASTLKRVFPFNRPSTALLSLCDPMSITTSSSVSNSGSLAGAGGLGEPTRICSRWSNVLSKCSNFPKAPIRSLWSLLPGVVLFNSLV